MTDPRRLPGEDPQLIARIRRRDPESLGVLFDRWADRVYSVALELLDNPAEAEAVVEEVFAQLWRDVEEYHPEGGSVEAWIVLKARRLALDHIQLRTAPSPGDEGTRAPSAKPEDGSTR